MHEVRSPGRTAVTVGWVLNAFAGMLLLGLWYAPHKREPEIEALLTSPSMNALICTVAYLAGTGMFAILSFAIGLYARLRHRNPGGLRVLLCAGLIFAGVVLRKFMPSSERGTPTGSQSFTAAYDDCEFAVTFPHPVQTREVALQDMRSHMVQSAGNSTPQLRAEFIPLPDTDSVAAAFSETLANFARLAGLATPEISVGHTADGTKGTYSGVKAVGDSDLRMYGIAILGNRSMLNCMIVEPLQAFPSKDAVLFMESITKRRP